MSIDARIEEVIVRPNEEGYLYLIDRPGKPPGIAGQKALRFLTAPVGVESLKGVDIWGSSESIILGDLKIAERIGGTGIMFVGQEDFEKAIKAYRKND